MRDFGLGKKSLEERVQDEARIVMDEMERQKKSFFPKRVYLNAISNIICGIVFGNRYSTERLKSNSRLMGNLPKRVKWSKTFAHMML